MSVQKHLHKDSLHHAYIFYGNQNVVFDDLCNFLEEQIGIPLCNNPDFLSFNEDVLTIDIVRSIIESSSRRAINGKKIYIIKSRVITREAQNALLKVLEEPSGEAHFFLLLQNKGNVLPTLLSRVQEINLGSEGETHVDVTDFINSSLTSRLNMALEISEEKDRNRASKLINGLLRERRRVAFSDATLKALEIGSRYIDLPSSSVKMLLENIALKFSKK